MPITVLMDGLPSRVQAQEPFDGSVEKYMAELPEWGRQATALEVNVNQKEASATAAAATATAKAQDAAGSADVALSRKNAAAASAADAAAAAQAARDAATVAQGVQLIGTSNSSLAIGTGAKLFVTQAGRQWPKNVPIIAVDATDASHFIAGTVGDYAGQNLTINGISVGGQVGLVVDSWIISSAGVRGAPGATASNTQFDVIPVEALDVDLSLGNYFTKTVAANSTFTFSKVPAPGFSFTLRIKHTAGVIALPANVRPINDNIPALATGKVHIFVFVTDDGGLTWRMGVNPNYAS